MDEKCDENVHVIMLHVNLSVSPRYGTEGVPTGRIIIGLVADIILLYVIIICIFHAWLMYIIYPLMTLVTTQFGYIMNAIPVFPDFGF